MGIRMRLHDGEPIGQALRRFKKLVQRNRDRRKSYQPKLWCEAQYHVPRSEIRRAKKYAKLRKAQRATVLAKRAGEQ